MARALTVGVALITHNAKDHLAHTLPHLLASPLRPRVVVVNSSSEDGTIEEARRLGAETLVIPRSSFNHGSTRELARRYLGTDIAVMMTPDAYPLDSDLLTRLVEPIRAGVASIAYARQLPHEGADLFEAFPRSFNYPSQSHIRSIREVDQWGVYTFFCSDACAAYRNDALDEIGGFPSVLTGEDTYAVARLLKRGHRIAYVAEAQVRHSHRYTLKEEFCRYFDTGLCRREHADELAIAKKDISRGRRFFWTFLRTVWSESPSDLPYAMAHLFIKWLGYRVGSWSLFAPIWWKRLWSSQEFYWTSDDLLNRLRQKRSSAYTSSVQR